MKYEGFVRITLIIILLISIVGCLHKNSKQVISKNNASFPLNEGVKYYSGTSGNDTAIELSKYLKDGLITKQQIEDIRKLSFVPDLSEPVIYIKWLNIAMSIIKYIWRWKKYQEVIILPLLQFLIVMMRES